MVTLLAFNLGNWYFGFYYFKCSSEIPFIGKRKEEVREELIALQKRNKLIFVSVAVGNIVAILLLGVVYMVQAVDVNKDWGEFTVNEGQILAVKLIVGTCQLVSFVFLLVGTFRIHRQIKKQRMCKKTNTRMMTMHVLSFTLYILSGMIYYVAEINYYTKPNDQENAAQFVLECISFAFVCQFFAQLF